MLPIASNLCVFVWIEIKVNFHKPKFFFELHINSKDNPYFGRIEGGMVSRQKLLSFF